MGGKFPVPHGWSKNKKNKKEEKGFSETLSPTTVKKKKQKELAAAPLSAAKSAYQCTKF